MKPRRLALLVAAALGSIALLVGARTPDARPREIGSAHSVLLGTTIWTCSARGERTVEPWIKIRLLLFNPRAPEVVAHELQHTADFEAMSCRQLVAGRRSTEHKRRIEARAFCQSSRMAVASGRLPTLTEAIEEASLSMALPAYGFNLTPHAAAAEIREACLDLEP